MPAWSLTSQGSASALSLQAECERRRVSVRLPIGRVEVSAGTRCTRLHPRGAEVSGPGLLPFRRTQEPSSRVLRRFEFVSMGRGLVSACGGGSVCLAVVLGVWGCARVSVACWSGGSGEVGLFASRAQVDWGRSGRPEGERRLGGADLSLRVGVCRIACASRRAVSSWATLAPCCWPGLLLLRRWRARPGACVVASIGGPTQLAGGVLGQRARGGLRRRTG